MLLQLTEMCLENFTHLRDNLSLSREILEGLWARCDCVIF